MRKLITSLGAFGTAALLVITAVAAEGEESATKIEALLGIYTDFDKNEITLFVRSNGCTDKKDISISLENNELAVTRVKPDDCKMMPFAEKFVYLLDDLSVNPHEHFSVLNPFVVNPMATIK